ncbi:MAG: histidine kinase [Saprospiraceae bacterium]|nr:histidine kinase [Saprospiraceae bacterium]
MVRNRAAAWCLTTFLLFLWRTDLSAQFQFAQEYEQVEQLGGIGADLDFEAIKLPINKDEKVYNIYEDSLGYIWIRSGAHGCLRYDGKAFSHISYQLSDHPPSQNLVVHDICEDHNGSHWLSTKENLLYFDNQNKTVEFRASAYLKRNQDEWHRALFNMEKTSSGELLIGTKAGMAIYDPKTDSVTAFLQFAPYREDDASTTNHIRHITADSNDENLFWCVTRSGFYLYNHQLQTFKKIESRHYAKDNWEYYRFRYNVPLGDWLFTIEMRNHLMGFDTRTRQWAEVGHWQDTTNTQRNVLFDIKPLDNSFLFLSSHLSGPFLIDPTRKKFMHLRFTVNGEKPPSTEIWGFCVDKNGYLWTSVGYSGFLLRSKKPIISAKPKTCHVDLQYLELNGSDFDYSRIKDNYLVLENNERSIALRYRFINPDPAQNWKSFYRLKGYSDTWESLDEGWIRRDDLNAGDFTLETKLESPKETIAGAEFQISVKPFWYERSIVWLLSIGVLGIGFVLTSIFARSNKYRNPQGSEMEKKMKDLKAKAQKSQLDQDFILTTLSSIKQLVEKDQDESAVHYLNQFSKFVRKVLIYSEKPLITLEEELEMCRLYLEMERIRFSWSFTFTFDISPDMDPSFFSVPPLLLQPYLEQVVWERFSQKEGDQWLRINVKNEDERIHCILEDNGNEKTGMKKNDHILTSNRYLKNNQDWINENITLKIFQKEGNQRIELIFETGM